MEKSVNNAGEIKRQPIPIDIKSLGFLVSVL